MSSQYPSSDESETQPGTPDTPGMPGAAPGSAYTPRPAATPPGWAPQSGPGAPYPGYSPTYPNYPGYPGYAGPASAPPGAPYPGYGMPPASYPSGPYAPGPGGYPAAPNYPTYPGGQYPPTLPAQSLSPYGAGMPGYPPQSAPPRPRSRWNPLSWTKGPIPLVLVALFFVISLALPLLAAAGAIRLANEDWAAGSVVAGVVALLLAGVYLVVSAVRVGLGRRTLSTILLGLAAVVVFGGLGAVGLQLPPSLHQRQAQALEASGNWTAALGEYQLAGEHAPTSHALARIHDEWGESLEHQGQYTAAIAQFALVISGFAGAVAEVTRAKTDDARVHLEYGTQLAGQGDTQGAINAFEYITATYAGSTYASQAHAAAAKAYLALGKAQISAGTCPDAISTYRTLVAKYGDTAEGKQAKTALVAPVNVKGQITNYPTSPAPTVYLSRSVTGSAPYYVFSNEYSATLGAGGNFTIANVKQGAYNLSALQPDGNGVYWTGQNGELFNNVIGPLCTFDLGTSSYT